MAKQFRKEKLSRQALDALAKRNSETDKTSFPYNLVTGDKIPVSSYKILIRFWKI